MADSSPRVLVIGLDGGTFNIFEDLFDRNWMPTFEDICEGGVTSNLASTVPPITAPAWTTFRTGVNPGKHGIFGFTSPNPGGEPHLNTAQDIAFPRFWNVANQHDKTVGVASLPFSFPAEPIEGAMVAGLMTSGEDESSTYPASLSEDIIEHTNVSFERSIADNISISTDYLDRLTELVETKLEMDEHLLETQSFDCYVTVYQHLDTLQHYFFKHLSTDHPNYDEPAAEKFYPHLRQFFGTLDRAIERLLEFCDDETTVLFVSDHGFGPVSEVINVNHILHANGFLHYEGGQSGSSPPVSPRRLLGTLSRFDFFNLQGLLSRKQRAWVRDLVMSSTSPTIDYTTSPAFFQSNNEQGIYVQDSMVDDREDTVSELRRLFVELEHPVTGDQLFKAVRERSEVYNGPYITNAPDLLVETNQPYHTTSETGSSEVVSKQPHGFVNGWHNASGILVATGNGVSPEGECVGPGLEDIAPTILTLLGVPVLDEMDGQPLDEMFEDGLSPVDHLSASEIETELADGHEYSAEDDERIRQRLDDLGYL